MRFLLQSTIIIFIITILAVSAFIMIGENFGGGIIAYTATDTRINVNDVMFIDVRTGITVTLLDNIGEGTITGRTPIWSTEGDYVSFWTFHNREDTFAYEIDLATYGSRNLTQEQNYFSLPIYGANEQRLFASFPTFSNVSLFLVNEQYPDGEIIITSTRGVPEWSPDGRLIAYLDTYEPPETEDSIDSGNGLIQTDLFVVDIETREITNYTESLNTIGAPVWSPDGSSIVFASRERNIGQLYLINVNTGEITEIPTRTRVADRPIWSPDGRYLAFTSNQASPSFTVNVEVMILDMETYALRNISNADFYDNQPTWSPDSRFLAFVSRRMVNQDEIYVANIHTGNVRRLTNTNVDESDISWRPR